LPNWRVGTLLNGILNFLLNPTLTVQVGDILSLQITTTSQLPFSIYTTATATASVYPGFSVSAYTNGSAPTLLIGAELAGKSLYYVCPTHIIDGMFGVIQVGGVALNVNANVRLHTYVLSAISASLSVSVPYWSFDGSLVGSVLNSVLGKNPIIYANVGDVITLRVDSLCSWTCIAVSTSQTAISVYAGLNIKTATGYLTVAGSPLVVTIGADVAGKDIFYISPGNLNMFGIIRVAASVSL